MVKILSNGDIVKDDDPRADQPQRRNPASSAAEASSSSNMGELRRPQQALPQNGIGNNPMFTAANSKLKELGLKSFEVAGHIVEPAAYAGLALLVLFMGFRGIIFFALIYIVSQVSSGRSLSSLFTRGGATATENPQSSATPSNRTPNRNSGHRLGNN